MRPVTCINQHKQRDDSLFAAASTGLQMIKAWMNKNGQRLAWVQGSCSERENKRSQHGTNTVRIQRASLFSGLTQRHSNTSGSLKLLTFKFHWWMGRGSDPRFWTGVLQGWLKPLETFGNHASACHDLIGWKHPEPSTLRSGSSPAATSCCFDVAHWCSCRTS